MQQHAMIPPVALGTNGHLPAIVAQAAEPAGLLTVPQQTLSYDEGLGAHRTAPIESAMRDIDDEHTPDENAAVPLLGAEVVVTNWKPSEPLQEDGMFRPGTAVEGRFTQLWLMYGTSTGTVSPAKAREIAREMRDFAARLEVLCDVADEIATDDYEADVDAHLDAVAAEYPDCPRCRNKMDLPGKSRATPDREIEICGPCCSDEAMREAAGLPWPAVSEWPVAREAGA
ncbi:hypothetical protein AB0937_08505 [Streptomyces sp. NPDC047880]|uniref:hypothetical protein n=1 Tax=Streptomyces sp. NPDC047880 TaxID=3155626 RepID=UPI00345721F5